MPFEPRLSLITLGVADMKRARRFYEALGFKPGKSSNDSVTFFQAGGSILALYGRTALAEDALVADAPAGFSGITIAYNCRSEAEVDVLMRHAETCGAEVRKPAEKTFWGGYSGYFADPDGHLWEVAHNPFFPLDSDGRIRLP